MRDAERNVPVIEFYRAARFERECVDSSYYRSVNKPAGEVAVVKKRRTRPDLE